MTGEDDERLLLAVLNTTLTDAGGRHDDLRGAEGLRWLTAHGEVGSAEERDTLIEARDTLQQVVRGRADVRGLARFLVGAVVVPVLERDGLVWVSRFPAGQEVAARVVLAWGDLDRTSSNRLRACANLQCERFLLDRSRSNQAKWCSMAICGNRAKARRHYQRSHAQE